MDEKQEVKIESLIFNITIYARADSDVSHLAEVIKEHMIFEVRHGPVGEEIRKRITAEVRRQVVES